MRGRGRGGEREGGKGSGGKGRTSPLQSLDPPLKLLLITNRKSHMKFRLVQKSVTLNGLERRNSPNLCVILPNSVALMTNYVKAVGDTSILSEAKM